MPTSKQKKPFKLTIPGILQWESEEWTVGEVALIMVIVMVFILVLIFLMKFYVFPVVGSALVGRVGITVTKILKSRSP